ncbi:MAG: Gfo/Idh/MocA family oxidoreductase, partial [Acutalibacteraceae bacterium]|nr:Gfo/Idh/MocA family oxidoreductase [Acutalibacteraceae bacterium]
INTGCNVIIEKPIALSIADADRIIEAAERMNVKVAANHQNRFNASIQKIRSAVEAGRFGKLFHATTQIRWCRTESYYKQASWRGTWENDGGALMNQCIHNIDILNWMLGEEPVEVIAMTDNLNHSYVEVEDLGLAIIRYKNGAYGAVEGTVNIYGSDLEEAFCLFGENGTVKADGTVNNIIENWRFADELDDEDEVRKEFSVEVDHIYGQGHTPLYADMIDAIKNDRAPYVDMYAGKKAVEIVLAIYKSSKEKRSVSLPLNSVATTDFTGMFNK